MVSDEPDAVQRRISDVIAPAKQQAVGSPEWSILSDEPANQVRSRSRRRGPLVMRRKDAERGPDSIRRPHCLIRLIDGNRRAG